MFSVVAKKSRTFSSLPCSAIEQVCRSWEGAEPGSQPKLANGNIPYHGYHAQFTNGHWPGGTNLPFLFLGVWILSSGSLNFLGNLMKFVMSGFCDCSLGTDCELVIGRWENCIVYSLFCIFIIIIITVDTSSSGSIYFVVLLNYLYLNPRVFPFIHFSSPSCWGGKGRGEQAAVWCIVVSHWVNYDSLFWCPTWGKGKQKRQYQRDPDCVQGLPGPQPSQGSSSVGGQGLASQTCTHPSLSPEELLYVCCQAGAEQSCSPSKGESGAQGGPKADTGQWPHWTEVCSPMAPEQEQELKAGDATLVKPQSQGSSDKCIAIKHVEVKLESKVTGQASSVRYMASQGQGWDVAEVFPFASAWFILWLQRKQGTPDQFLHNFS